MGEAHDQPHRHARIMRYWNDPEYRARHEAAVQQDRDRVIAAIDAGMRRQELRRRINAALAAITSEAMEVGNDEA